MNRISRRSAPEAAEALLEAGRTEPALHYDVESGLARHHHWLRSEAPMPEWASASAGFASASFVSVVSKTLVSAVLVGALAVGAWYVLGRPQPSAANVEQSSPAAERTPSVPELGASEAEASMVPRPIPVPDQGLPSEQSVRRTVRADAPDKRTARVQRAHRELASARAASARVEPEAPRAETPEATPAASATAPSPDELHTAAQRARPEPEPRAQVPDDLLEMQQVATAEQLLERSPERALALVRQGDQRFAGGYFRQERAYIATMALIRLGRIREAQARAARFAKEFPALPYGARIRSALEAREAAVRSAASRDAVP